MPEELRVFVRAALYLAPATAVYSLVSDDQAGLSLLGGAFVSCTVFVVLARPLARRTGTRPGGLARRAASLVALDDEGGDGAAPLEVEEEPVVTSSPWPLGAAFALMLIGLGLLYGPWLWVPGGGLAAATAWGWFTQTDV